MPENLYPQLPTAPPISQESFNIEMVRKYYQDIANLKEKYTEKQRKYKNAYNRLLNASTGASTVALASGVSTIGTSVTIVGIPISASLAIVSTVSTFNNKRFKEFISDIYPKELTISETTESTSVASYLDLLFTRDRSNNITTKLYDKRDAFGFHIVNFPFMSSNIPSAPAYGVYASQLIRYARCCSNYSDFLIRHRALVKRLLSQGYKVNRLSNTFKKFYGRHTDLVGQYKKNVCQMFADSIS